MKAIKPEDQPKLDALLKIKEVIESGYAGVTRSGNIVDRRKFPTAIPIPKNPLLGTPQSKQT